MNTIAEQIAAAQRQQRDAQLAEQQRIDAETANQRTIEQSRAQIANLSFLQQQQALDERIKTAQLAADGIGELGRDLKAALARFDIETAMALGTTRSKTKA